MVTSHLHAPYGVYFTKISYYSTTLCRRQEQTYNINFVDIVFMCLKFRCSWRYKVWKDYQNPVWAFILDIQNDKIEINSLNNPPHAFLNLDLLDLCAGVPDVTRGVPACAGPVQGPWWLCRRRGVPPWGHRAARTSRQGLRRLLVSVWSFVCLFVLALPINCVSWYCEIIWSCVDSKCRGLMMKDMFVDTWISGFQII